jgi:serine/arginine repetitive matrix protein 2
MLATPPPVVGSARHSNAIPTIRFVAATPSNAGSSFESNVSSPTVHLPQAKNLPSLQENSMFGASPLAPSPSSRKRLVPKKSKLSILGGSKSKPKERDLSDVVRRVGGNSSTRGGFDIYVDPTEDPEIGEIIMVKKKKSRVGIDGLFGEATSKMMASSMSSSQTPLGDSTNAPVPLMGQVPKKQSMGAMSLLKRSTGASSVLKSEDENSKWWSISRGRKDSKPKTKDSKGMFIVVHICPPTDSCFI